MQPWKINISEKYTTQDVKNVMDSIVEHVNYMEQGTIGIQ